MKLYLMAKVVASREWYEEVLPMMEKKGFRDIPDKGFSDPETDGELMGYFFEYNGKELPLQDFVEMINEINKIMDEGETMRPTWTIVGD
ncbi:MAG: hypothetical protein J7M18_05385 [Candidatus Eremiobacteraeota bacterium]|nr:hypothetical protein [Candidatus Eremiobacteraeota bacterium]